MDVRDKIKKQPGIWSKKIKPQKTPIRPQITQEYKDYADLVAKGQTASQKAKPGAYGYNKTRFWKYPVYGPVDYDEWGYDRWDTVGQEYRQRPWVGSNAPLLAHQMTYLNSKGFFFLNKIGSGGFGDVWRVRTTELVKDADGNYMDVILACKILSLEHFSKGGQRTVRGAMDALLHETFIHGIVSRHANIVKFTDVFKIYDTQSGFPKPIHVLHFMELCNGDLKALIQTHQKLDMDQSLEWLCQIVDAVKHLHDNNIAHMDIKPNNVLYVLDPNDNRRLLFKLTDFGLTQRFSMGELSSSTRGAGTARFMAPEIHLMTSFDAKCADIYSLGITLALSLSGYGNVPRLQKEQFLLNDSRRWNARVQQRWGIDHVTCDLLQLMTHIEPKERPLINQVQRHPFVAIRPYISGEYSNPVF